MLLATPGQTTAYACVPINSNGSSSNNNSISSNLTKSHKLGRTTYKLIESSQNDTQAAVVLKKSIAVRANRNSGYHSVSQSLPSNNIKPNATINVNINDNGINYIKKPIVVTTNNLSKGNTKTTSSSLPSSSATNVKSSAVAATTLSTSSSSSSSLPASTKVVLSASFLKTFTVPPTDLHRYSVARSRSYSVDSLYEEMCHFKPIRSVPTTRWKCGSKSRGATIKAPKACLGQKSSNCDVNLNMPPVRKDLKRDCSKAKAKVKPKLSANLFPHLKPNASAFVRLLKPICCPSSTRRICKRQQTSKPPEFEERDSNMVISKIKKRKSKGAKKQLKKAINPKLSNTKKRKAQTQPKKCESTILKKPKNEIVNRKTPPVTRQRIRLNENCKLYGPLT